MEKVSHIKKNSYQESHFKYLYIIWKNKYSSALKGISIFILHLFLLSINYSNTYGQTTITIETGSAGTDDAVLDPYYNYNYSQQIYLSSEITADGGVSGQQITKIRFFYYVDAGDVTKFNNWTVYAGNTTKATFTGTSDWIAVGSMTQVFSGTVTFPAAGNWVEITLPTPFTWTGNNLVIAVDENTSGYAGDYDCWRYTSTSSNYRTIYYNNDGTNPNPSSPPTASGITYNRPDVQLVMITPCSPPTSITTSVTPSSSCSNPQSVTFDVAGYSGGMLNGGSWEYQWENSSHTALQAWSATSSYVTSLTATTTYHVHMRSTACPGSVSNGFDATYTLNAIPAQPGVISGNSAPCIGASVSYSVTNVSGVTYTWTVPAGWSITAGQGTNAITVTVGAAAGNIQVMPSNVCGNGTPRTLATTPGSAPVISVTPNPASACGGIAVVLTASGSTAYSWSPAAGLSATTGISVTANPTTTTTYTVTETSSGCNSTTSVQVKVGPSVSATASVSPGNVCPGNIVNLTSSASQGSSTIFSENFESGNSLTLVNGTQTNKWFRGTNGKCNGSYGLYVSNNSSSYNYDNTATSVTFAYFDVAIPAGATNVQLSYNYRSNGESGYDDIKVFNTTTATSPAAGTTLSGEFITHQGINICSGSGNINLSAYSGSTRRIIFQWRNDYSDGTQSPGMIDDILITGSLAASYNYSWSSSGTGTITSPSSQNTAANPTSNSTYTVTVTQTTSGCTATASTSQVTMDPIPSTPVIIGPANNCNGLAGIVYSVTSVTYATTYTWTVPTGSTITGGQGTTSITMTMGANNGNVTCTAYDACGRSNTAAILAVTSLSAPAAPAVTGATACGPQSVILSASGGTHYHWYDAAVGGNLVNDGPSTYTTPVISIPTTYYVAANNGSCDGIRTPVTAGIFNGGLDNYTVSRITGITYTDISATGTSVSSWKNGTNHPTGLSDYFYSKDDNLSAPITLPFDFPYDGGIQKEVLISLDGFITFNKATNVIGADLYACGTAEPYTWQNDNFSLTGKLGSLQVIAPFYNDLYVTSDLNSAVKYTTTGSAPNRKFIVQWKNMSNDEHCSEDQCTVYDGDLNFQVWLYETSGDIEFYYGSPQTQTSFWCSSGSCGDAEVDEDYSVGLNSSSLSASPTVSQLLTQQTANTATFSNTPQNNLTILPTTNSKIKFARTAPAAPTQIPSSICQAKYEYPANGSTNQCLNQILSWTPGDGSPTSYDVYFGTANPPPYVTNTTHTYYNPGALNKNTTYYWKIVPKNAFGNATNVQIYSFSTGNGDVRPTEILCNIGTQVSHVASGTNELGQTCYTNTYEICDNQINGTLSAQNFLLAEGSALDWTNPVYFLGFPIVQCTGAIPTTFWGNCAGASQTPILTIGGWFTAMFNGGYLIYDVFTRGCNINGNCTRIIIHLNNQNAAPTSVTASPNPVCQGSTTTTLTANGATLSPGASYVWYTGGCGTAFLANTGTTNTLVVSPNVTTTYWVRVEGGTVCASTTGCQSVTVTVNNPVTAVAPDITQCTNGAITMTGATAGGTVSSIAWSGGAGLGTWAGSGNNPATYTFTPSVPIGSFVATLTVYGTAPCGNTSDNAVIAWGNGNGGWNGSYNTNWYDDRNWCGYPTCLIDVTIPSNTAVLNQPTINPSSASQGPVPHAAGSEACKNIVINSGATLTMTNNANLNVCGDWTNNGTFAAGNGTVTFIGSVAQNINTPSTSFYNITINNSSPTGVTLVGGDQTFTHTLVLSDGILYTGNNKIIGTSFSPTSIAYGGSNNSIYASSWVNGWIRRSFANNAGDYDFPVGTTAFSALAKLTNTTITGSTAPTYFDATFLAGGNYSNTNSFNSSIALDFDMAYGYLFPDGIWYIQPDGNVQPLGGSDYALKLYFNGFNQTGFIDNEFGIVKRPVSSISASDWTTQPGDGAGPANTSGNPGSMNLDNGLGRLISGGYVLRFHLSSFSHFGIAKKTGTLPVELYSFRAFCDHDKTYLTWSTLSELDNDYFTLEKSENDVDFNPLATITGAGTSNQLLNYSYMDDEPYSVYTYYRLSQTDYDGSVDLLGTISARCKDVNNDMVLYPNPVKDVLYLYFNDDAETEFTIAIYNKIGELVFQKKLTSVKGENVFTFTTNDFADGLYTIIINHQDMPKVSYLMIAK